MKKLLVILFTLLLSGNIFSQSIGGFIGYGGSTFGDKFFGEEAEDENQAKYIPLGAHILFGTGGNFEIGAEINYAVVPFVFGVNDLGDLEVEQLYYGALAKFKIGSGGGIWPYVRGGAGLYTGSMNIKFSEEAKESGAEDKSVDFKSAFGFNVGGGAELDFSSNNGIFAELVYHIVNRELDVDESESFKASNWAIQVGFHFGL
jgi:opacity protein-like surface antigen